MPDEHTERTELAVEERVKPACFGFQLWIPTNLRRLGYTDGTAVPKTRLRRPQVGPARGRRP